MLVIVTGIIALATRRAALPPWPWLWGGALLLLPVGGLVSAAGENRLQSFLMASMFALYLGVLILALTYQARISRVRHIMPMVFLATHTLSLMIGLAQVAGYAPFGLASRGGRINGLATHPNIISFMAVIAIFICVAYIMTRQKIWYVCGGVLIIANLAAITFAKSLSVILAFLLAVALFVWLYRKIRWALLMLGALVVVVAVCVLIIQIDFSGIVDAAWQRIDAVVNGPNRQRGSLQMRTDTYVYAWSHIARNPLVGVGVDSSFAVTGDGKTVVHNFFLHSWYQGGIIFAAFSVGFLLLLAREILRSRRLRVAGVELSIVFFIVIFGATSALFLTNEYWFIVLACLAFSHWKLQSAAPHARDNAPCGQGENAAGRDDDRSEGPAHDGNLGPLTRREYREQRAAPST